MSEFSKKETKEFLLKFCKSHSILLFKDSFSHIMGKKPECLFFDNEGYPLETKKKQTKHVSSFLRSRRRKMLKDAQVFKCTCDKPCLEVPIVQGDHIYGYVLVLHLKKVPEEKDLGFMNLFIDLSLREFQKAQELNKLYDTIRPRAIALSTIHTIHRLLSSTLNMDELIERIARLTSQVLRARYCSIMLLDDSKSHLIAKAVIDLKGTAGNSYKKHRRIRIGLGIAGKTAKTGKAVLLRDSIYVPLVEEDIIGVICAKNKTNNAPFSKFDMEILLTLAEQAVIAIKNSHLYEEQKKMAYGSIKSLAALLDAKSPHTYTHHEKFVKIVLAIAGEMRLSPEEIRILHYAALLPDTGRFTVPEEILRKQGDLSRKEYSIIKKQHIKSFRILEPLAFLKPVMPLVIHNRERYDGTGYPDRLKGEQIPIGARIMAVADAFEAMVFSRPYKDRKISISQAIKEIVANKGTQFDPSVVDAFIAISKKSALKELFKKTSRMRIT